MRVGVEELRQTVSRMEEEFEGLQDRLTVELLSAYTRLKPRFAADLADERDELLSRGAALMLVQEVIGDRRKQTP
jgi:hypothetical protein